MQKIVLGWALRAVEDQRWEGSGWEIIWLIGGIGQSTSIVCMSTSKLREDLVVLQRSRYH